MKSLVVVLLVCIALFINGCTEQVKTPPWSDSEVEKLTDNNVNTVPIAVYKF